MKELVQGIWTSVGALRSGCEVCGQMLTPSPFGVVRECVADNKKARIARFTECTQPRLRTPRANGGRDTCSEVAAPHGYASRSPGLKLLTIRTTGSARLSASGTS